MRTKLTAAVLVYDTPELLPHFLNHYGKLGVDKILVGVATNADNSLEDIVQDISGNSPVETSVSRFSADHYVTSANHIERQKMLEREHLQPDDWVVYVDLDEFHEYPVALCDIVRLCNQQEILAIEGEWLDRIARDGTLAPILATPDIGDQFPIGCRLSRRLLHNFGRKVMICRWKCNMTCAGHHHLNNCQANQWPIGAKWQYRVHHFKWNSNVLARLAKRLEMGAQVCDKHARSVVGFWNYTSEQRRSICPA